MKKNILITTVVVIIFILSFGYLVTASPEGYSSTGEKEIDYKSSFVEPSSTEIGETDGIITLSNGEELQVEIDVENEGFLEIFKSESQKNIDMDVTLNGNEISLPYESTEIAGEFTVIAKANGFNEESLSVIIEAGKVTPVQISLDKTILATSSTEEFTSLPEESEEQPTVTTPEPTVTTPEPIASEDESIAVTQTRPTNFLLQNIIVKSLLPGTDGKTYVLDDASVTVSSNEVNALWDGSKYTNTLNFKTTDRGYINKGFYVKPNSQITIGVTHSSTVAYSKSETVPDEKICFSIKVIPRNQRIRLMGILSSTGYSKDAAIIYIDKTYLNQDLSDYAFNTAAILKGSSPLANVYIKTEEDSEYKYIGLFPEDGSTKYFNSQPVKLSVTPRSEKFTVLVWYVGEEWWNPQKGDISEFTITTNLNGDYKYERTNWYEIPYLTARTLSGN